MPILVYSTAAIAVETPEENSNPSRVSDQLEDLILEAQQLFASGHPIDARAKLQKALKVAPSDHRPYVLLGTYYLGEVGHFRLAYRYLIKAKDLFENRFGDEGSGLLQDNAWRQHARILYLLSEAKLNLDNYQGALETLNRFEKVYWDDWLPGTKAWVLMKLKKIDEAIKVAQAGLIRGADLSRTYNILGILLSLKGNRELALKAFSNSIRAEMATGGSQISTPLNNAGEVYRELFLDNYAEAAWRKAINLPDGCDHILPSLNLAIILIDEMRLLQAERVLNDFQACYANNSIRADTEHRALIALGRGRIELRKGKLEQALHLLQVARERQQWYGKIGTNENDIRFASSIAMSQAIRAQIAVLRDTVSENLIESVRRKFEVRWLLLRAWWLERRAREIGIDELNNLEDLYLRHTDAMLEYPTLGEVFGGFYGNSFEARIRRMIQTDTRKGAQPYYYLYWGSQLLANGKEKQAIEKLEFALSQFRPIDRLARAETLAKLLEAYQQSFWWFSGPDETVRDKLRKMKEELYSITPSHLRFRDLQFPVRLLLGGDSQSSKKIAQQAVDALFKHRFEMIPLSEQDRARFELQVNAISQKNQVGTEEVALQLSLRDKQGNLLPVQHSGVLQRKASNNDGNTLASLVNTFLDEVFSHQSDPAGEPLPELDLLP